MAPRVDVTEIDYIEISDQLARAAGELARAHGLRGVVGQQPCPNPFPSLFAVDAAVSIEIPDHLRWVSQR